MEQSSGDDEFDECFIGKIKFGQELVGCIRLFFQHVSTVFL